MPTTTPQKRIRVKKCLNEGKASSEDESFMSWIKTPPKQEANYRYAFEDDIESEQDVPREVKISSFDILLNGLLVCGIIIFTISCSSFYWSCEKQNI